tara:strand:- start:2989 stop:3378 length:390 start_codon:yes stop_codon:yes gene_type:complete
MITEIINGIYIGDINSLLDKNVYKLYNIDIVINLTTHYQFLDIKVSKIKYPIINFTDYLDKYRKLIQFIYSKFINYNILICSDEQYHTLTAALFLINYGNIPEYDVKSVLTNKNEKLVLDYDLSIFKKK